MRYYAHNIVPAHQLHYNWSGWPSEPSTFPPEPPPDFFTNLAEGWQTDGLHLVAREWQPDHIHLTLRVEPHVTPVLFAGRVKGRLQHAMRHAGMSAPFSRKVSMRSVGENTTDVVERYLRDQLEHVRLADPRYRQMLAEHAVEDDAMDLDVPTETDSGRYWFNLHLVLVTAARFRVGGELFLDRLRAACGRAAEVAGCRLKAVAIMPDHLHAALRGPIDRSPVDIGVAFQEATAQAGLCRLWDERFYVGTFSAYGLDVIRLRQR